MSRNLKMYPKEWVSEFSIMITFGMCTNPILKFKLDLHLSRNKHISQIKIIGCDWGKIQVF